MTSPDPRPPTDYRRHRRETDRKLAIAVVLFLDHRPVVDFALTDRAMGR
jgi:hypothetical protein